MLYRPEITYFAIKNYFGSDLSTLYASIFVQRFEFVDQCAGLGRLGAPRRQQRHSYTPQYLPNLVQ